jgi:predicted metal-dependent hydrolase
MPKEATGKTGVPADTRLKPVRPRDELGRPLPWDAESRLQLPDFDAMTLEENDRIARELLAERNVFGAHEAWETAWKQAKGTGDEELFKGLSQMGAGYVHLLRGNAHGAMTLLRRGASRVVAYPDGSRGIATTELAARLEADAAAVEGGTLVPGPLTTLALPAV